MGTLVPEDFPMESLANDAERRVVEAFRDGLTDGWMVLPDVGIHTDGRDHQLDVVLIHQSYGVLDIEVKGRRVEILDGIWRSSGRPLTPQPFTQARNNAYALRNLLRRECAGLGHLEVEYAAAFPNVSGVTGHLPPDIKPFQVITDTNLVDPAEVIEELAVSRAGKGVLAESDVEAMVAVLRPDADFHWDSHARIRASRTRLDELCASQVRVLEGLDANRKVVVQGAAGTGKTRLAMRWASRARRREERVLLTCYNEPLADRMAEILDSDDEISVGPFMRVALGLEGMPHIDIPEDADHHWWTVEAVAHLQGNWHRVTEQFDTIVVDEAQDFSPAWLAQLFELLDPDGPRRMLLVADLAQQIYNRGFRVPALNDGWTHAELVSNCRNAREIGQLLRRRLNGAAAPAQCPEATGFRFVEVTTTDATVAATWSELDRLTGVFELDPTQVAVLTFSTKLRNRIASDLSLQRWEERNLGVICENVHRVKGLEVDSVILVADQDEVLDELLYVGISRAISHLVVIGSESLRKRLGFPDASNNRSR